MNRLITIFRTIPTKWYLSIILAIGALARFIYITKSDIWHDEGYTMMIAQFNPLEIIERTARDVHPPLYYLAISAWQWLFGTTELATRSFSAVCGLVTIVIVYLLVRKLFTEGTARLAALFVALGPFTVRYSDEARMYGMAAMLVVAATYVLVRIATNKYEGFRSWLLYAILIAASLYTHYYTLFIIPAHIVYLVWVRGGLTPVLRDKNWWSGNLIAAFLFVPWLPSAFAQITRVSEDFWIPPINSETVPNTFMQFLAFSPSWAYPGWIAGVLIALFTIAVVCIFILNKRTRPSIMLLSSWLVLPLAIVMLISLVRPVYYDRYFIYCSVAMYILLAVIVTQYKWPKRSQVYQVLISLGLVAIFIHGIVSFGEQATHRMGTIGSYVSSNYRSGDAIVSGELYTYFDFSYYNRTSQPTLLFSKKYITGYGETSLLYDRQETLVVHSLDTITAKRIWLVGKADKAPYYQNVPSSWRLVQRLEAGNSVVQLYEK